MSPETRAGIGPARVKSFLAFRVFVSLRVPCMKVRVGAAWEPSSPRRRAHFGVKRHCARACSPRIGDARCDLTKAFDAMFPRPAANIADRFTRMSAILATDPVVRVLQATPEQWAVLQALFAASGGVAGAAVAVVVAPPGAAEGQRAEDGGDSSDVGGQRSAITEVKEIVTGIHREIAAVRKGMGELQRAGGKAPSYAVPTEEEARRLFALMVACHTEHNLREAPVKAVFDLYCKLGFSARETALRLKCSKATVINRLALLRQRTGVSADHLRDYKPFFEQIESSLAEPRARRIRRGDAIYGDDPDE